MRLKLLKGQLLDKQTHNLKPIRVMIVDDHDMVRMGLKILIESVPELEFAGEASNGNEAVTQFEVCLPDVVLMDILMPEMDGVAATKMICGRHETACIIALTSHIDESFVHAALEAGAISYLLKGISSEELLKAIQDAYVGKSTLAPQATQALVKALTEPQSPHRLNVLEIEILQSIARGLSNAEIASKFALSEGEIVESISTILGKIKVTNRTEATTWAINNHLVDS
jgi:two-component system, NarL family, response regulator LiaR